MFFDKKIVTVMLHWDYGQKERGDSGSKIWFYDTFVDLFSEVSTFWFDDYMDGGAELQKSLIEFVDKEKPDLVFFVPNKWQFDNETLDYLRTRYNTCAWFGDDQWRYDDFSSKLANKFSFVITTDPYTNFLHRKNGVESILSEWAAIDYSSDLSPRTDGFMYEVSFVGGKNSVREWFINKLESKGIEVECFGSGWSNGRVGYDEMGDIFNLSKINLNLSNSIIGDIDYLIRSPKNIVRWLIARKTSEQVKARNFEVPMSGGFQLTNYVYGLESHFEIGREVAAYSGYDDCAKAIEIYLGRNDLRNEICRKGYERAHRDHSYQKRFKEVFSKVWEM
ncbi:glycosyltransferase [Motiliproteus sp. MSK22-1]|uniref:CgeB family protein n=1 Tax=Motiliproteus sp. MSK22-1 TaxID=1897630 RepID=UPI0009773782|nr:glycosyltransferase [Motiliproteus sp. MSK22-1]OMH27014.1 hypothetical protein BGP75_00950 [Motiliproteus sp. MSK22-1]